MPAPTDVLSVTMNPRPANHGSTPMSQEAHPAPAMTTAPAHRLVSHLIAAFAAAFVDNIFRAVVAGLLMAMAATTIASQAGVADPKGAALTLGTFYVVYAGLAFLVPMVAFAPLAGSAGDRWPKHLVMRWVRLLDIPVVVLGVVGAALPDGEGKLACLLACLALLGTAAAFYSTVKYSALSELVPPARLSSANAILQAVSTAAILCGYAAGGLADPDLLHGTVPGGPATAIAVLAGGASLVGIVAAWRIPALPAQAPGEPLRWWAWFSNLASLRGGSLLPAAGLAGFWALGMAAQLMIAPVAYFAFGLGLVGQSALGLCLAIGIVCGALLAPRLNHRAWPGGLPAIGAALAGAALVLAGLLARHALADPGQDSPIPFGIVLFLAGMAAGLWEIPLQVLVQERSPDHLRNRALAAANVLGCIGMVASSFLCLGLLHLGLDAADVLLTVSGIVLVAALVLIAVYRTHVVGATARLFCNLLWDIRVEGAEHMPRTGGVLVVSNHPSYADGLLLAAALPRHARFLVYQKFTDMPVVGWLLRWAGAIRVASDRPGRALIEALDRAAALAKDGAVVGILPEGKVYRGGTVDTFKPGIERVAKAAGVPVLPVHIDGIWGGWWSLAPVKRWRDLIPLPTRRITIRIGAPLPPSTPAIALREAVVELGNATAQATSDSDTRTLGAMALSALTRRPFAAAVTDIRGKLPAWKLGAAAVRCLPLLDLADDERRVGVLLPPGGAGTMINLALALDGRTAVNLNHTAGEAQVRRMCEMAGLRTIISAGAYLERIAPADAPAGPNGKKRYQPPVRTILVEERLPRMSKLGVLWQAVVNQILPARWLDRAKPGDVAAIVFSSGSTGDPKGVVLTHRQLIANAMGACNQCLEAQPGKDALLSPLPLFHSFGLAAGMWLPLIGQVRIIAHGDPTDAVVIGRLAGDAGATCCISTATFVRGWMRRIDPSAFARMRRIVVGAERCPAELREEFFAKYKAPLLEGYGCTELAPVVGTNLPDATAAGLTEIRLKQGSVGRPIDGIAVFTIDPDTGERRPAGSEGLLVVRSPGRMQGYLDRDDLTAKAFVHGGYSTGDIGRVDADGFVHITGRMARFAKVAGEMVPLDNVESAISAEAFRRLPPTPDAAALPEIAVAAVPDAGKGERLVILHTGLDLDWNAVIEACADLPPIWRPKARDAYAVAAIPRLGTGKRDLGGVKKLAAEVTAKPAR
jgi:acyl-[acyl-carrier-protein]-phospholipid O-acyltransferase/long-chain-fatty-acid--[acyl-carrier-protein] ligase